MPGEALGEAWRPGSETARLVAGVLAPFGGVGALAKLTKRAVDVTGLVGPVGHALYKLRGAEGSDRIVALKAAREFRKSEPELYYPGGSGSALPEDGARGSGRPCSVSAGERSPRCNACSD